MKTEILEDPNPLTTARIALGLSKAELAKQLGMTWHALHHMEKGLHQNPSPKLLTYLSEGLGVSEKEISNDYTRWVNAHRPDLDSSEFPAPVGSPTIHPFLIFRKKMSDTRVGFCKRFKVHNAVVYSYENNTRRHMPVQVYTSLMAAGMGHDDLSRLDQLGREFYDATH